MELYRFQRIVFKSLFENKNNHLASYWLKNFERNNSIQMKL
jgi:hypothetical protein